MVQNNGFSNRQRDKHKDRGYMTKRKVKKLCRVQMQMVRIRIIHIWHMDRFEEAFVFSAK